MAIPGGKDCTNGAARKTLTAVDITEAVIKVEGNGAGVSRWGYYSLRTAHSAAHGAWAPSLPHEWHEVCATLNAG